MKRGRKPNSRSLASEFSGGVETKTVVIKLLPEEFNMLCELSRHESRSVAQQLRHLARQWMKQQLVDAPKS